MTSQDVENAHTDDDELRAMFSFTDGDRTWPFVEDEDANVTGYGHQDREAFADALYDYDRHMGGPEYAERIDPDLVTHKYAVLNDEDEDPDNWTMTWGYPVPGQSRPEPYTDDHPGVVPITCAWGVR